MRFGKPKDVSTLLELNNSDSLCQRFEKRVFLLLLNVSKLIGP